ncbi:MAG: hypothetical protein DI539_28145, partial [Flavobacterium psychrophilum]
MKIEQKELLSKLDTGRLRFLKEEAEKYIANQIDSENIIISKATGMFQLFLAALISIVGYLCTLENLTSKYQLLFCGLVFLIFIGKAVYLLHQCIYPSKTFSVGIIPKDILYEDVL